MTALPTLRRLVGAATGAALVLVGALVASPAAADTAPVSPGALETIAADALPTVQIDGVVWAQVVVGNTVYAAGSFTTARPSGSAAGVNTVPRANLLAYDITTGELVPGFDHQLNGQALGITASPDGSRIYVVGEFTQVDGEFRVRIAAFDTATGALVSSFRPTLGTTGRAVAATNSTVYVGGDFTSVAGVTGGTLVPKAYVAAFDAGTGAVTPFTADADAPALGVAVTADQSKVVIGGRFTTVNGAAAYGLAAADPATGASLAFPANTYVRNAGTDSAITSLWADETGVYGTGYHFGGGGNLEGTFRADPTTLALVWVADCHGDTYSSYRMGDVVYSVGHAHYCGNIPDGFPQTTPWTYHHISAFSVAATQTSTPDIYGYGQHPGQPAPTWLHIWPQFYTGTYTGQGQAGWSITGNDDYVVMGGEFTGLNGQAQQGLVRFAKKEIAPNKQGPRISGAAFNPRLSSTATGTVRIDWSPNWDRDNETLTYRLYRGTDTGAPIHERTVTQRTWVLTSMGFTDTGLSPGSSQQYRLTATDPFGNVARSEWVTVTVASSGTASAYLDAVRKDEPTSLWRLGETSGTTAADTVGTDPASTGNGVTRNVAGATGDGNPAATFSGTSSGWLADTVPSNAPDDFTVEAWVRTTSSQGGKIIGFGSSRTATSTNADRHLYLDNTGRVFFGMSSSTSPATTATSQLTVNSPSTYRDGQWHQVVGTYTDGTMALYVDGKRVAQRSDIAYERSYWGYWRVGGDRLANWPSRPTSDWLNGSIDDPAVYWRALTAEQVLAHYTASGRTSTVPPVPADAYGTAVRAASPDLYWRLGEASGTTASDSGTSGFTGGYRTGVTLGTAGALTGVADTAVTFNGSSGLVSSNQQFTGPTTYSEELWFRTTSTGGGKLIGFGNAQTGLSSTYDRHVYLDTSGRVVFGVNAGTQVTLTSPNAYNDGQWHHMVAAQDTSGMRLYLDGVLVGSNATTTAQSYSGYWRVGGDRTWAGQQYFPGVIDEVAVYSVALPAATVAAHNQIGRTGLAVNQTPSASFTTTVHDLAVQADASTSSDPDGTIASYAWTFGDGGTGTGVAPSHTYAAPGTYTVGLTVTDDRGGTASTSRDVTVAANGLPTAAFGATVSGMTVLVDGSASSDPDDSVAAWAWDFGDGATGSGPTASHTYAVSGTYQVTLTVTDADGGTASTAKPVVVANQLAADAFSRTLASGWGSADAGGTWTLTGAASNYAVGAGVGTQRAATAGATRAAYLTAVASTDTEVSVVTSLDKVQTGSGTNVTVVARRAGTAEYGARLKYASTGTVTLSAMATSTALGSVTLPGTFTAGDRIQVKVQAVGTSPTTLRAKAWRVGAAEPAGWQVSVTDSTAGLQVAGGVGVTTYLSGSATNAPMTASFDDFVAYPSGAPPAPNQAPVASFTSSVNGLAVQVDGSGSSDPDGFVASWSWSFGDGSTATGASASHTYAATGTYPVTLTVTDDDGATTTTSAQVAVQAPNVAPTAAFTVTASELTASVDGTGSSDPDGTIAAWAWTFGDGGTGSGPTTSHLYAAAGTYDVTLTVTDDRGATASTTHQVTVTAPALVLARDTFTRVVNTGWDAGEVGGAWTLTGSAANYAVTGGVGVHRLTAAGVTRATFLDGVSSSSTRLSTTVSLDKAATGGGTYVTVSGRRVGTTDYAARLKFLATGVVQVSTMVGGTALASASLPGTYTAGDRLSVLVEVSGSSPTTVRTKVWRTGEAEPSTWLLTSTDSTAAMQTAGSVGLTTYLSGSSTNAPVAVSFDDVLVTPAG